MAALRATLLLCTLLVAPAQASLMRERGAKLRVSQKKQEPQVSPELEPKSSHMFFRNDYPHDLKPPVNSDFNFNHPYPLVQDTDQYDKDYIKDENADNGEWQAQMEYDILRNKVFKAQADADRAKKFLDKQLAAKTAAERKVAEAESKAKAAKDKADMAEKAKTDADNAVKEIDEAGKKADADSSGNEVKDAQDKLAKEIDDFKECEERLAKAKEHLKKVMAEKEEWDAKTAAATEEANKQYEKDKAKADAASHMSEEEAQKALEKAKKAAEKAKKAREEIEKHKKEYAEAHKRYQDDLDEVERDEKSIDDAKRKLKEMRAKQIAEHGGISRATGHDEQEPMGVGACKCEKPDKPQQSEKPEKSENQEEGAQSEKSEKAESESEPCPPCPVSPAGGAEGDTLTTAPPCSEGEGKKTEPEGAWSWPIPGMAHGTALAAARPALALLLVAASIHLA